MCFTYEYGILSVEDIFRKILYLRRFEVTVNHLRVRGVEEATSLRNILQHMERNLSFQWHGLVVEQIVERAMLSHTCVEQRVEGTKKLQ